MAKKSKAAASDIPDGASRGQMPEDAYTAVHGIPPNKSFDRMRVQMPRDLDREKDLTEVNAVRGQS